MNDHDSDAPRFLISYAHDDDAHVEAVARFRDLLRGHGLNVVLDSDVAPERHSWPIWAMREIAAARRVLIVGSPRYRARFDETAPPAEGRGVRLEARLILEDSYQDMQAGCRKYVPVLLPGARPEDIPAFFQPVSAGYYAVEELTPDGVRPIVDLLGRDPADTEPTQFVHRSETGPIGVFRLRLSGGTPEARDAAVQAFLTADDGRAVIDFDDVGRTVGALLDADASVAVRTLARLVRRLNDVAAEDRRHPLDVTVGVHLASNGRTVGRAAELASSDIARRMHAVPRARVVVIVSPGMYRSIATANAYPQASAYRQLTDEEATVYVAVAGRNVCPELHLEPAPVAPNEPSSADGGSGQEVAGNVYGLVGNDNVVHGLVGNVVRNEGSGSMYVAGRDIKINRGRP